MKSNMNISRFLIVCLAGFLLLFNTACSNVDSSKISSDLPYYKTHSPHLAGKQPYYKSRIAQVEPGSDFVPYYKSRSIRDTSDRNYDLEKVSNKADQSISRLKEDVADKTQQGFYKARKNLKETSKNITRAAEDTADAAQSQLHDTSKATRRAIEDVGDAIKD
jgi:hypothetical protein